MKNLNRSLVKTIGIVAPSFVVPNVELELGAERLRSEGFHVRVHPQCIEREGFLAGNDESRAQAFLEYVNDPEIDLVWFARGGYGAARLLPLLSRIKNPKKKTLVGYSDATVLLNFVHQQWGWRAIHAMMPGGKELLKVHGENWAEILSLIKSDAKSKIHKPGRFSSQILSQFKKWEPAVKSGKAVTRSLTRDERGFLNSQKTHYVGGNIAVLSSLAGTPYFPRTQGAVIFLEDVTESPYRIDRMINQLRQAGFFRKAKAVLLGTFTKCSDPVPSVWTHRPPGDLQAILQAVHAADPQAVSFPECQGLLRESLDFNDSLRDSFRFLWGAEKKSERVPVYLNAPIGHGGGSWPLELG